MNIRETCIERLVNKTLAPFCRLSLAAKWGCFRRPEFSKDFVTYDVIPPLHLERLVNRFLAQPNGWHVARIEVVAPIACEWLGVATAAGEGRALALREPHYVVTLKGRVGEPVPSRPQLKDGTTIHLGLSEHLAIVRVLDDHEQIGPVLSDSRDLGWMPVAIGSGVPASPVYQRFQLVDGVVDLATQDDRLRAR